MILSNKYYDGLKWVALVLLPALATFYLALAQSWNLPYPTEVAASLAALDIFLATLLGISTSNYKVRVAALNFNPAEAFTFAAQTVSGWVLSKNWYDILTWIAQIFLPALSALYFALAPVWGLPYAEQVVATLAAIDTFLGLLLGFSTAQFHKQVAIECIDHPAGMTSVIK
jgi:hypothetical protein